MSKETAKQQDMTGSKSYLGFWIYLMTDCILFGSLFATYAVLRGGTHGGPDGRELFDLNFVLVETILLLVSSFVCGLGIIAARAGKRNILLMALAATFALGAAFVGMELYEFSHLIAEGHGKHGRVRRRDDVCRARRGRGHEMERCRATTRPAALAEVVRLRAEGDRIDQAPR